MGLRSGTLLQLSCPQLTTSAESSLPPPSHTPQLQLITLKALGSLPVVLVPLPTAVGLVGTSLVLSDRLALLHMAPGTGRAVATALAVAGVAHAVPLWQPATLAAGSGNSRCC